MYDTFSVTVLQITVSKNESEREKIEREEREENVSTIDEGCRGRLVTLEVGNALEH